MDSTEFGTIVRYQLDTEGAFPAGIAAASIWNSLPDIVIVA